ncbi:hypothetical protein N7448_004154 [Penicillium atrosanguineum]|uniref:Uncharacterized protein n=1 Tax=Penicillium atrosanguineum TaxID=1132637 RepID=A0A9W9PX99_9EURO|nr:uncharacterized protein N7443_003119 [Penicillium atrosanguineum]KAJ5140746.1 hypothetical protein N7448_004154 [Penicillium atrosanguineum]KAJ5310658.1 hypothetical protein N7443_003119 [Penicillium atrosanguineum]KAJ5316181.1 hypothetical protein N7476_006488 [Penicillium atrosanguineum]
MTPTPAPQTASDLGMSSVESPLRSREPGNVLFSQSSMDISCRASEVPASPADEWVGSGNANEPWVELGLPGDVVQTEGIMENLDLMQDLLNQPYLGNWLDGLDDFPPMDEIWAISTSDLMDTSNHSVKTALDAMRSHLHTPSEGNSSFPEEEKWRWYSTSPQLNIYDEDVINVLLNLAKRHISASFAIFSDFEAKRGTRTELFLAMAATASSQ